MTKTNPQPSSIGPGSASSTKRQPRKLDRAASREVRPESTGGVPLPVEPSSKGENSSVPVAAERHAPRRRRPKKSSSTTNVASEAAAQKLGVSNEIEALKQRVVGIEDQLKELLLRTPSKLPRRRLRRSKTNDPEPDDDEEARDKIERLETELTTATRQLENLRRKNSAPQNLSSSSGEELLDPGLESDIEEIPRPPIPTATATARDTRRSTVTLSGSYRIPLPSSVSEENLRAIQRGIASAQRIARGFLNAHHDAAEDHALSSQTNFTRSGSGWSSWLGGYSMSIARFVNRVELGGDDNRPDDQAPTASSNERSARPNLGIARAATMPAVPRRRPQKLEIRSKNSTAKAVKTPRSKRLGVEQAQMAALLA